MTEESIQKEELRPWQELENFLEADDTAAVLSFVEKSDADDIRIALNHLSREDRMKFISIANPEDAAEVLNDIPESQAVTIIEDLEASDAATIIEELPSDDRVDILKALDDEDAEAIISQLEEEDSLRKLIQYDSDCAGGLMITEFLSFDQDVMVEAVVGELREKAEKYQKFNVQYIYVTAAGKFAGVVQMRNLILSPRNTRLSEILIRDALTVRDLDDIDELINFFDSHDFYGVPVVNELDEMVGVVLRKDIRETEAERSNIELLETQGIVGGEELRTMSVWLRSRRRLSWLSVNIILNIIAASVIALYQDTLSAVIALAVFLPVISDMSGCSGNQAVAVSLRELSLGLVRPFEVFRVWVQEISVGIINGLALGLLIGVVAWLWQGSVILGLVIGAALCLNTMVAVSLGGMLPLILKKWNVDPALASGPILTTVTDMMGFFLALSFTTMALSQLT